MEIQFNDQLVIELFHQIQFGLTRAIKNEAN